MTKRSFHFSGLGRKYYFVFDQSKLQSIGSDRIRINNLVFVYKVGRNGNKHKGIKLYNIT
jgi:hypothetical protein